MKCFVTIVAIGATGIEIFGSNTSIAIIRFPIRNSCTEIIAHNTESALILKTEWWGSALDQEEKF
jgi:hypothetical protein